MADLGNGGGLLVRLRALLGLGAPAAGEAAARARWPHLLPGWVDPNVPLQAWRTTVDAGEAALVLRAIAEGSEGRVGAADVAEVLDCIASTADGAARAFRFGAHRAFLQLWVGAVPRGGSVQLTLLCDLRLVDRVTGALSIGAFPQGPARDEWDRLRRFFLAGLRWQWTEAPGSAALRAAPAGPDAEDTLARLERITGEPGAPLLESLRGLRRRVRVLLDDLATLDAAEVAAADAWLAARGAPTLTGMRGAPSPAAPA